MSIKKSFLMVIVIIVAATAFSVINSGGNAMLIDMNDTAISFSGIDDFKYEIAYADILSLTMQENPDYASLGGHELGVFRVGHLDGCALFVTTQCDRMIIAELADGSRMIFNYNNQNGTQQIYEMLQNNLS